MSKMSKFYGLIDTMLDSSYDEMVKYCNKNGPIELDKPKADHIYGYYYDKWGSLNETRLYAIRSYNNNLQVIIDYNEYLKYIYNKTMEKYKCEWISLKYGCFLYQATFLEILSKIDQHLNNE